MLLGWIVILLVLEHFQGTNKCRTSIFRIDHGIDIAGFRRLEWVGKGLAVLLNHLIAGCGGIFGFLERVAKDDTDGALRTHDCNLSGWIGQVDVAAEMLARHHDIAATVGLARHDCHLRHRGFGIGVK